LEFLTGSSIKAARYYDRYILALEGDKKIFDGVLKQLQSPPSSSKSLDFNLTSNSMDLDDDSPTPDIELDNLCEGKS
jgi:hypothetical protein